MQNYGLGRGLASLIPQKNKGTQEQKNRETKEQKNGEIKEQVNRNSEESFMQSKVSEIDINLIDSNPHQPRLQIDEEKLVGLAQSIKQHGIIQPLVVSQNGSRFELIAGERRFQAAKQVGLSTVPIVIREAKEKEKLELALVENVQRYDLNAVEEARAYKKLTDDFQMSQEEVALRIGKSRSSVANKIRLLGLPVEIQRALAGGQITEGHAKAILAMDNPEKQRVLFELIIKQNLTVRQTENKTREISVRPHKRILNIDPQIKELEDKLVGFLGTKVKIAKSGGGGRIIIEYYSEEELNNILNKISNS
ncbi:MAG: ParB/RepB/Spo0J family partition protein [Candidatus Moranbacteria bacterium]|nr:ParB/RepB/Spo0J family partition protein [Candidatus Moranbacteria bacterium]